MSLLKLKSGTDIRGVAIGDKTELSDEAVKKITRGFLSFVTQKTGKEPKKLRISVGHDSRISAERIKKCVISVLSAENVKILDCALSSTPAMFMTTVEADCDAAVQITASHHPYDKNGLKFFTRNGGLDGGDIAEILSLAEDADISGIPDSDKSEKFNFTERYAEILRGIIKKGVGGYGDRPLEGSHIIVDAGNGAGGFFATEVLEKLGADISGSLFLEPDGMFPNHIPNPENETAMKFISDAVISSGADLGVIFDTDVDRAACVDSSGEEINRNRLVALASAIALSDNPGGTIVTDSVTSDGLTDFIENSLGGRHHRFKRGYKNVINEAARLNAEGVNCPLAIETSGHAALRENYFLDDGAYLMTKIIILLSKLRKEGKTPGSVIAALKEPKSEKELRFKISAPDFREYGEKVFSDLFEYAKKQPGWTVADNNYEGVRISLDKEHGDGWMLLRMSVHDPVMPFNAQSNTQDGTAIIIKAFSEFISEYDGLSL